jgi:hypothetical protein
MYSCFLVKLALGPNIGGMGASIKPKPLPTPAIKPSPRSDSAWMEAQMAKSRATPNAQMVQAPNSQMVQPPMPMTQNTQLAQLPTQ